MCRSLECFHELRLRNYDLLELQEITWHNSSKVIDNFQKTCVPIVVSTEIDKSGKDFICLQLSTAQLLVTLGFLCSQGREIGTFMVQLVWPVWDAYFWLRLITAQKTYQFLFPDCSPERLAQM